MCGIAASLDYFPIASVREWRRTRPHHEYSARHPSVDRNASEKCCTPQIQLCLYLSSGWNCLGLCVSGGWTCCSTRMYCHASTSTVIVNWPSLPLDGATADATIDRPPFQVCVFVCLCLCVCVCVRRHVWLSLSSVWLNWFCVYISY